MCFVLLMLVCVLICQAKSRTSFALVHESLVRYKQHYGHLNVPYNFVCDNKWPKECQKLLLGQIVSRMRTRGDFLSDAKNREVVISLGLRLDKDSKRLDRFDKIICALLAFQSAYGHTQVPVNFVVPCSDRSSHVWPLECQGLRLGLAVDGIRRNGNYCQDKSRKARLEALGVLELCQDRASPLSDNLRMKWRQEGSGEKPEYSPRRQQRRKFSDHDLLTALTTFNDRYSNTFLFSFCPLGRVPIFSASFHHDSTHCSRFLLLSCSWFPKQTSNHKCATFPTRILRHHHSLSFICLAHAIDDP